MMQFSQQVFGKKVRSYAALNVDAVGFIRHYYACVGSHTKNEVMMEMAKAVKMTTPEVKEVIQSIDTDEEHDGGRMRVTLRFSRAVLDRELYRSRRSDNAYAISLLEEAPMKIDVLHGVKLKGDWGGATAVAQSSTEKMKLEEVADDPFFARDTNELLIVVTRGVGAPDVLEMELDVTCFKRPFPLSTEEVLSMMK